VRFAGALVAVALALALQTTLAQLLVGGTVAIDLVLVAVVSVALTMGPVSGLLSGSVAGLVQDALSSGVLGIGGLAKSVIGFVVGVIGQQFILTSTLPRFAMFVGATAAHALLFIGLYVGLGLKMFPSPWKAVASQAIGNAVVGVVAFAIVDALPGFLERRRAGRRPRG